MKDIKMITLTLAKAHTIYEIEYEPEEKASFIIQNIVCFKNHKVVAQNQIFTVMETRVEILKAIREECDEKR